MGRLARRGDSGSARKRLERFVQRLARAHRGRDLVDVRSVVPVDLDRLALDRIELVDDLLLVVAERRGEWRKARGQLSVFRLLGELPGPIQGEVEVASPVV